MSRRCGRDLRSPGGRAPGARARGRAHPRAHTRCAPGQARPAPRRCWSPPPATFPSGSARIEATIAWSADLLDPVRAPSSSGWVCSPATSASMRWKPSAPARQSDFDMLALLTDAHRQQSWSALGTWQRAALRHAGHREGVRTSSLLESGAGRRRGAAPRTRPLHPPGTARPRPSFAGATSSSALATLGAERDNLRAAGGTCSRAEPSTRWPAWSGICSCTGGSADCMPEARGWMDAILADRHPGVGFARGPSPWATRPG